MVFAGEKNSRADFVCQHPKIVFGSQFGDAGERSIAEDRAGGIVWRIENEDAGLQRSSAEDRAGGIVWRIENEDAGLRSDFGGDFVEVGLKPILLEQAKGNGNSAEAARE